MKCENFPSCCCCCNCFDTHTHTPITNGSRLKLSAQYTHTLKTRHKVDLFGPKIIVMKQTYKIVIRILQSGGEPYLLYDYCYYHYILWPYIYRQFPRLFLFLFSDNDVVVRSGKCFGFDKYAWRIACYSYGKWKCPIRIYTIYVLRERRVLYGQPNEKRHELLGDREKKTAYGFLFVKSRSIHESIYFVHSSINLPLWSKLYLIQYIVHNFTKCDRLIVIVIELKFSSDCAIGCTINYLLLSGVAMVGVHCPLSPSLAYFDDESWNMEMLDDTKTIIGIVFDINNNNKHYGTETLITVVGENFHWFGVVVVCCCSFCFIFLECWSMKILVFRCN